MAARFRVTHSSVKMDVRGLSPKAVCTMTDHSEKVVGM